MTMTKRQLVIMVAEQLDMPQSEVGKVVEEMLGTITRALVEGTRWEFRDFGVFTTKTRRPRVGRNPRTGQSVHVPDRRVVVFTAGKKLKERLANTLSPPEAGDTVGAVEQPTLKEVGLTGKDDSHS